MRRKSVQNYYKYFIYTNLYAFFFKIIVFLFILQMNTDEKRSNYEAETSVKRAWTFAFVYVGIMHYFCISKLI